jgi:hypothetical protein
MSQSLNVIIVEKTGTLKSHNIKEYNENELYKKCGFKKAEGFIKQHDWNIKYEGKHYIISVYGKLDGKANTENKYDFPPPIDTKLFFGNCLLLGMLKEESQKLISLTLPLWEKIYEKMFGGFEDLSKVEQEDEDEEDELEHISKELKTKKGGYLKDGFVVDSDEENDSLTDYEDSEEEPLQNVQEVEETLNIEDIGSELSEESYEYDTE